MISTYMHMIQGIFVVDHHQQSNQADAMHVPTLQQQAQRALATLPQQTWQVAMCHHGANGEAAVHAALPEDHDWCCDTLDRMVN